MYIKQFKQQAYNHGCQHDYVLGGLYINISWDLNICLVEAIEGQAPCAHLPPEAPLDEAAHYLLLSEVQVCFTKEDNQDILALPESKEVTMVLKSCNEHSAPGTDSLTADFYQKHWDIMGKTQISVIQHVFQGNKPSPDQRTSLMVFGNKPSKKANSLKNLRPKTNLPFKCRFQSHDRIWSCLHQKDYFFRIYTFISANNITQQEK